MLSLLIGRDVVEGAAKPWNTMVDHNRRAADQNLHRRWKFVSPSAAATFLDSSKPDRNSTADVFDSDKRVVLQTAREASWQDSLTRLGLSVTPQDEQPEARRLRFRINSGAAGEKGLFINARRCGVHGLWLTIAFVHLACDLVCG